ncbi:MarR family transcriptional regulator [Bradyrhizobium lablabi]|uniref:MarR family winged helix-turn-helix transcriptional regulator n=1 Tax=Bradyrhizobium lablabi TaxID=722472 RepID=UPI001BA44E44|nr:winged helix DNA-binding protein [Bradyrhizobium lablabi]
MDRALFGRCNCFTVRKAARALTQAYDAALAPAGIRATQFMVLAAIDEQTDLLVQELANIMMMDRTTMGKNIRPLTRDGLVSVAVCEADRRGRRLRLTKKGRAVLNEAYPLWKCAQDSLQRTHGSEFLRKLRIMLEQLS